MTSDIICQLQRGKMKRKPKTTLPLLVVATCQDPLSIFVSCLATLDLCYLFGEDR